MSGLDLKPKGCSPSSLEKVRILTFVKYFLPGYRSGGPVRSLAAMVQGLSSKFEFLIVTSDRDALVETPYEDVRVGEWNEVAGAKVYYASPRELSLRKLRELMVSTSYDILYLNSFFNPTFTLLPLLVHRFSSKRHLPVVIAPRGEFSPGALRLKGLKKRMYIGLSRFLGLYEGAVWHASSELEAAEIRAGFAGADARVVVAPNLSSDIEAIPEGKLPSKDGRPLRVIFLSRVTRKKNLRFILEVLSGVRHPVELTIAGVIDDAAYWEACQQSIRALPPNICVTYVGAVPHSEVGGLLAAHDLFFLPTLGENFGHAILESLAAGTPVLISDQTPWKDIEEAGVGWIRGLGDLAGFAQVVCGMCEATGQELALRRARARQYAERVKTDRGVVEANQALFSHVFAATRVAAE